MERRQPDQRTPYEEYCAVPEDVRCELINDEIVMMGAASLEHQRICGEVFGQLWSHLRNKRCQAFQDVGVRFTEDEPINNALRPDIVVVCDPSKYRKQGIVGAPDLVIEVLSPPDVIRDAVTKLDIYMKAGVLEYWIIHPVQRIVHTFILDSGHYILTSYVYNDHVPVTVLDDFAIDMGRVFIDHSISE
ncbi:hypothetical protein AGMMS49992_31840 [Clostridia bacterium]|nr:hypothetical protein AGMMS49992_31840 [Clostridia bacterium]